MLSRSGKFRQARDYDVNQWLEATPDRLLVVRTQLIQMGVVHDGGLAGGMSHQVLPVELWHPGILERARKQMPEVLQCGIRTPAQLLCDRMEFMFDLVVPGGSAADL